MPNSINELVNQLIVFLGIVCILFLMGKYLIQYTRNRFTPVKTVKAQVIQKTRQEVFSKYSGSGTSYRYVVVFSTEGKTLSFYVSEFSYGSYKIKQRGTLKYKGDRLIDFH